MILADENIDSQLVASLRTAGLEVYAVAESCPGITDAEVIPLARHPPRILLTEDKDFGEWVFAHGIRDSGIVWHLKDTE